MYDLARNNGEVAFINAREKDTCIPKAIKIVHGTDDDDICHTDVKIFEYDELLKTNMWHHIDVKDVEEKNFKTGKYSLSKAFSEFHKAYKPYGYYTAFRVIQGNARTNKFILVNTQDMFNLCELEDKDTYSLVALKEIMQKCNYRLIG